MNSKREKGMILVIVLGFMLIVVIAATAFMLMSSSEIQMVRKQNDSTIAFYIAEGGLQRAKFDLNQDSDWTDGSINGVSYDKTDVDSDGFYLLQYSTAAETALGGSFTIRLKDITGSTDEIWIKSKGKYNDAKRIIQAELKSSRRFSSPQINYAIETEGNIDISGNVDINPDDSTNAGATLNFEDIFGVDKAELEKIAKRYYPETYYNTTFDNGVASTEEGEPALTWVSAAGTESKITQNGWEGAGILIVDGNLKITGGTFNGVIWVIGSLSISGNPVITGAIFVEGGVTVDTTITGTARINLGTQSDIDNTFLPLTSLPSIIEYWHEVPE